MSDGVGLSVGATNLAAVVVGRTAVTRSPVVTLYPHRPPEVGVPSENPNLTERGLIITDFVDRVGDPVGIVAADGSTHLADKVARRRAAGDAVRGRPRQATRRTRRDHLPGALATRRRRRAARRRWPRCRSSDTRPGVARLRRHGGTHRAAGRPRCADSAASSHCATSAAPGPASRSSTPPTVSRRSARPSATPTCPATSSTRRC